MEARTSQRLCAYLIDTMILVIITSLLTFWIPVSDKYKAAVAEEDKLIDEFVNQEVKLDQFIDDYYEARFTEEKEKTPFTLISAVLYVGYFATFAYYNRGQTLGKKLLKIRVVDVDGNDVSHNILLCRVLVICGVLTSLISVSLLQIINGSNYLSTVGLVQFIQSIILLTSFFMIAFRADKRGLHDVIFKTKVIKS